MNEKIHNNAIVITGIGMVSSLGHDVVSSCAAYRAGLSRTRELDSYQVFNEEEREFHNLLVHQIPIITNGFEGFARLLRIGWAALEDLFVHNNIRVLDHRRTGFYVALPDFGRIYENIPKDQNALTPEGKENFQGNPQPRNQAISLGHKLCNRLTELTTCMVPKQHWHAIDAGHASMTVAIEQAMSDITAGKLDRCIVEGLDSFLDIETLEWLHKNQRLKTEENTVGLQPGEAGACLLLEKYGVARQRRADVLAVVTATGTDFESDYLLTGRPALGQGLVRAVSQLLSKIRGQELKPKWIVTDQNGEPYRAYEWGHALVRLSVTYPSLREASLWYPATSFGDTGAASGGVAICSVVRAFMRHYAVASDVIITSSSDRGERTALYLTALSDQ
jgi:3-oxoacyl-[acyl-carrier-protein] synthase-1